MEENLNLVQEKEFDKEAFEKQAVAVAAERLGKWIEGMPIEELNLLSKMVEGIDFDPLEDLTEFADFLEAFSHMCPGDACYDLHLILRDKIRGEIVERVNREVREVLRDIIRSNIDHERRHNSDD